MKVLVSGATGLLGSALVRALTDDGQTVLRLTRRPSRDGDVGWDPAIGRSDAEAIDPGALGPDGWAGVDAVVHLAGENIAGGRWTRARKARIRDSRVDGTSWLARQLAVQEAGPRVMVCASAIGYYGDRGEQALDEQSTAGTGFLADVCQAWEAAAAPAREAGVRVAHLRFGGLLARAGGMLAKMLPPFRLGVGGVVGSGDQWLSWLALEDAVGIIQHVLDTPGLDGPINAVTPQAVRNRTLTRTLGRVLGRPTRVPLPATVARWAFGELADELLLASTRVVPGRLQESAYAFRWPELEPALRHLLDRPARPVA